MKSQDTVGMDMLQSLSGPNQWLAFSWEASGPVTQVELGAVPMGHRTLVHVSCLLVAIGFQWSAHNQPGKEKNVGEDIGGGAPSWRRMEPRG